MDRREKSAYHEAGHVVSYFVYTWKVTGANIKQWQDGATPVCGQTFANPPSDIGEQDAYRSDIVATLAGPLSGQRAAGERPGSIKDVDFHDDAHRVLARVTQITKNGADCRAIVQSCQNQALDFIELQWPAITAIANALLEKTELTEAEIKDICLKNLVDPRAKDGEHVDLDLSKYDTSGLKKPKQKEETKAEEQHA